MQSEEKSSLSRALAKSREEKERDRERERERERERNEVREGGRQKAGGLRITHGSTSLIFN